MSGSKLIHGKDMTFEQWATTGVFASNLLRDEQIATQLTGIDGPVEGVIFIDGSWFMIKDQKYHVFVENTEQVFYDTLEAARCLWNNHAKENH